MTRQGSLFDEPVEPHGQPWLRHHSLSNHFPDATDIYHSAFEVNVWHLLKQTSEWATIQTDRLEAILWIFAIAQEYCRFLLLTDTDVPELEIRNLLEDDYAVDNDELARALLGYDAQDIEDQGFPDFETHSPHDALIDDLSRRESRVRRTIREAIGAPELCLNFYRDPLSWDQRLLLHPKPMSLTPDRFQVEIPNRALLSRVPKMVRGGLPHRALRTAYDSLGELSRRQVSQRRMRAKFVILHPPSFDLLPSILER